MATYISYGKCSIFEGFERDPQKNNAQNGYGEKVLAGSDFCTFAIEVTS
jgi:hypothetical protein